MYVFKNLKSSQHLKKSLKNHLKKKSVPVSSQTQGLSVSPLSSPWYSSNSRQEQTCLLDFATAFFSNRHYLWFCRPCLYRKKSSYHGMDNIKQLTFRCKHDICIIINKHIKSIIANWQQNSLIPIKMNRFWLKIYSMIKIN